MLLGDVAPIESAAFVAFMDHVCALFDRVYLVPGNHEYYGSAPKSVLQTRLHALAAERWADRLTILDCATCDTWSPGFRLIGCTLWSHVATHDQRNVERYVRDYDLISDAQQQPVTVADTNAWHAHDVAWLRRELQRATADGKRAIVLTHFAPLERGTSHPRYEQARDPIVQSLNHAFRTDLRTLITEHQPHTWAFGHTHWCCTLNVGATRVVSEPLGYPDESVGGQSTTMSGRVVHF